MGININKNTIAKKKKIRSRAVNKCHFYLISSISAIGNKNNNKQSKKKLIVIHAVREAWVTTKIDEYKLFTFE